MADFEPYLRAHMDTATYVVFFGGLVLLALLELSFARGRPHVGRHRRWPTNFALTALNILVLGALPVTSLMAADWARAANVGALNHVELTLGASLALGVLARSFGAYWLHVAMHRVPFLWRFHRIHHSDKELDVSTTVRMHPVEFILSAPIMIAFVVAMGISPLAIIVFELLDAGLALFTHANIRLPRTADRLLQFAIVTPDMHRIHHSSWQPETDSNYGATLSLWDRVFRTYRRKADDALTEMELGLVEDDVRHSTSFLWLLVQPFGARHRTGIAKRHGTDKAGLSPSTWHDQ